MTFSKILLICFGFAVASIEAETHQSFNSPETQVSLLELYTSQGCSSCPPADAWVSQLKHDERLWETLIPIAFHVNYWDYIGWRDRFASRQYSLRQRKHSRDGNVRSVYTPGFVLNGREWRSFFGFRRLDRVSKKKVGILKVNVDQQKLSASFSPTETQSDDLILNIAILGFDLSNKVNAGENRGRTLRHDFVALGFKTVRLNRNNKSYSLNSTLPSLKRTSKQYAVVTWVSSDSDLTPIQATGGYLL